MSSSGSQVNTCVPATWPTIVSDERRSRVASAMNMSRSVTTPASLPFSTTGRIPQSASSISSAAAARLVSGSQVVGCAVMMSLTFTVSSSRVASRLGPRQLPYRNAHGAVGGIVLAQRKPVGGVSRKFRVAARNFPLRIRITGGRTPNHERYADHRQVQRLPSIDEEGSHEDPHAHRY